MIRQSVLRRQLAAGLPLCEEITVVIVVEALADDELDLEGGSEAAARNSVLCPAATPDVAPPSYLSIDELLQMELARPRIIDLADAILAESLFAINERTVSMDRHPSRYGNDLAGFDIVAAAIRICREVDG